MRKLSLPLISLFVFLFFFLPSNIYAKVVSSENKTYLISEDEVVDDDLFFGGNAIEIYGTVNGDVYIGADTVRVDGVINGDLHIGAGVVNISGSVEQDVYIGAGNVTIYDTVIGDSLIVGGGNVSIDKNSSIGGSVLAGAGTLSIYSPVGRNLFAGSGTIDLNSEIQGEVRIGSGTISIGPDTIIGGNLYYSINEQQGEINISEKASVSGMIKKSKLDFSSEKEIDTTLKGMSSVFGGFKVFSNFISLIGALIIGLLILKFFRIPLTNTSDILNKKLLKSIGVGFIITLLAIPTFIILAITVVGLPLAYILLLILLFMMYLAKIVVSLSLGNFLYEKFDWKKSSIYLVFIIGLAVVYLLKIIPFVGFLLSLLILWGGLGSLVLYFKSLSKNQ